jgi:hypothetical protein
MYRLILLVFVAMATAVLAQESTPEDEAATETDSEIVEGISDEEFEDLDLGNQEDHTEEDDDVFKPTDAVSFEQSVPFPVDI